MVVYTWREDRAARERVALGSGASLQYIDAGPPVPVARDSLLPFMPEFGRQLARSWTVWRPDIVHADYWMSGLASMEAAEAVRVPLVQTFHALGVTKVRNQGAADTSPRERVPCAKWRSCRRYLRSWRRANASSWSYAAAEPGRGSWAVVPCGVDTFSLRAGRGRGAAADSTGRIVSVGRLVERKGVDDVVRGGLGTP